MLVTFDSNVGGFTMFGDVALKLLKMMGHSGTVPERHTWPRISLGRAHAAAGGLAGRTPAAGCRQGAAG
jgi:hypothetical protein